MRDKILQKYPGLTKDDVRSTGMGQQGCDIQLSTAAKQTFGMSIECKNLARFAGYAYYDQAEANREEDTLIPIAVVKANRRDPLVLISLEDFLKVIN